MGVIKEPILNFWYRALHSPFGVEVSCSDSATVRAKLYSVRKEARDTELSGIAICISPFDPSKLWLVKRSPSDAET